jgi:hypothetical protein
MLELTLSAQIDTARTTSAVIDILQKSKLPARFKRGLLRVWASENGVILTGDDYAAAGKQV